MNLIDFFPPDSKLHASIPQSRISLIEKTMLRLKFAFHMFYLNTHTIFKFFKLIKNEVKICSFN
jgi:hypothetical protein